MPNWGALNHSSDACQEAAICVLLQNLKTSNRQNLENIYTNFKSPPLTIVRRALDAQRVPLTEILNGKTPNAFHRNRGDALPFAALS